MTIIDNGIEYIKTNLKIFCLFLNKKTPVKKIGNIYHNLLNKTLKETRGIEEVIHVISIQKRYNMMHVVTGCLNIGLNKEKSYPILNIIIIIKPNKIGSVGNAISTFKILIPISAKDMDKGVKNITRKKRDLK